MFKICRDTDGGQRIINYLKNKRSNGVEDPFEECGGFILSTKLMTAFRELGPKLFKSGGLLKRGVRTDVCSGNVTLINKERKFSHSSCE